MIYLWTYTDFGEVEAPPEGLGEPSGAWKHEKVKKVDHLREAIAYYVKKQVRDKNDAAPSAGGKVIYNHYVPYRRIKDALIARLVGKTRAEIIKNFAELRDTFGFGLKADPWESKHAFHVYVNSVFSWICDYSENIFLGQSRGDLGGQQVDLPINGSTNLHWRLQVAAQRFYDVLGIDVGDHNDVSWKVKNPEDRTKEHAHFQILWDPIYTEEGVEN